MIEKDLVATAEAINSREDFIVFLQALRAELLDAPDVWENQDLPSFLEALARWVADMDGYYKSLGLHAPKEPSWKILGDMLMAATTYE